MSEGRYLLPFQIEIPDDWNHALEMGPPVKLLLVHKALHASAPPAHKCADCTMDGEPCPLCYAAWWQKKHPHTHQV